MNLGMADSSTLLLAAAFGALCFLPSVVVHSAVAVSDKVSQEHEPMDSDSGLCNEQHRDCDRMITSCRPCQQEEPLSRRVWPEEPECHRAYGNRHRRLWL